MAEEQHPIKALVEGIVSTVLAMNGIAFPICCAAFSASYTLAKNGEAVCPASGNGTTTTNGQVCTEEQLSNLVAGFRGADIAILIAAIIVLGAAIILGIFAHKYAVAAGNVGKAKAGNITGMIGLILGAVLLVMTIIFAIVGIATIR